MASPPFLARVRLAVLARRVVFGAAAGLVGIAMLTAWVLPATASQVAAPSNPLALAVAAADSTAVHPTTPRPATMTRKARHIPDYPRDHGHHGKRIVYDKALMTVWLISATDEVVARFPVVGRWDRPVKGTYRIYSKSPHSSNPFSKVTFDHMVRFAWGPDTKSSIGFHSIPRYYDGTRMHSPSQLGLPIARGGCVRLSDRAAAQVYRFLDVGDLVVVLPSP